MRHENKIIFACKFLAVLSAKLGSGRWSDGAMPSSLPDSHGWFPAGDASGISGLAMMDHRVQGDQEQHLPERADRAGVLEMNHNPPRRDGGKDVQWATRGKDLHSDRIIKAIEAALACAKWPPRLRDRLYGDRLTGGQPQWQHGQDSATDLDRLHGHEIPARARHPAGTWPSVAPTCHSGVVK